MIRSSGPSAGATLGVVIALATSTLAPSVHLHVDRDGRSAALHRHLSSSDDLAPADAMDHAERGPAEDVEALFAASRGPSAEPAWRAIGGIPVAAPAAWTPLPADRGDRPIHGPPRADTRLRAPPLPAQRSR